MKNLRFIIFALVLFALSDCKKDTTAISSMGGQQPASASNFLHPFNLTANDQYFLLTKIDSNLWQADGVFSASLRFRDVQVRNGYVYGYLINAWVTGTPLGTNNYTIITGENELGRTFSFQITYCTATVTKQKIAYNFSASDSDYNAFIHSLGILNDGSGFDMVTGQSSDIGEMDPSAGTYIVTRLSADITSCDSQRIIVCKFIAYKNTDGTYSYAVAPVGYNDSPIPPATLPPPPQI